MRLHCALLVIAALLALSTQQPARADELPVNPQALRACVSAAASRVALGQCQGISARYCIEQEGPGTISDVLCWSAESDTWLELIAEAGVRLDAAEPERAELRRAAHAAWSNWVEAECWYRAWEVGGGSGEQVIRTRCSTDLIVERAIELIEAERAP